MLYERSGEIERAPGAPAGQIRGLLVTDGEASDGHILNIDGGVLPKSPPLLFGHDDRSGRNNLGSWIDFETVAVNKKLRGIRGTAQIELTGPEGADLEWRQNVAHMIDKKHIGAFSVRWEEITEPIRRVNLPSDHPAFVDASKNEGRKAWGYYFEKWRMMEGSVVTLGADPAALIGRMQETSGEIRGYWRSAINAALVEHARVDPANTLVAIQTAQGEIYMERAAWAAMLELANERLSLALDLYERIAAMREDSTELEVELAETVEQGERADARDEPEPTPERKPTATLPVTDPLIAAVEAAFRASDDRFEKLIEAEFNRRTGRVTK